VIDYKTKNANCSPAEWLGERPDEPQLPLYSVLLEAERDASVAGVLFAQVRLDNPRLVGAGAEALETHQIKAAETLGEVAADWPALKAQWRAVLENLAAEFIAGSAQVDPKTPQVCQYCALGSICRIGHQNPERAGAENAA
jgi:ATP-dependent helicase/nuclease subunit B